MTTWVYIIQSVTTGKYYCGQSDNIERRLDQHNDPNYKGSRTTKVLRGPWELIWKKTLKNRGEAIELERKIKKRGIGRYLADING